MIFLGWDVKQWAIAIAVYQPKDDSVQSALEIKRRWQRERRYEPGEERILIAKRLTDVDEQHPEWSAAWDAATNLYLKVHKTL